MTLNGQNFSEVNVFQLSLDHVQKNLSALLNGLLYHLTVRHLFFYFYRLLNGLPVCHLSVIIMPFLFKVFFPSIIKWASIMPLDSHYQVV